MVSKLRLCRATQSASASASATVIMASTSTASCSPKIKVEVIGSKPSASPKGLGRSPTIAFPGAVKTFTLSVFEATGAVTRVVSFRSFCPPLDSPFDARALRTAIHLCQRTSRRRFSPNQNSTQPDPFEGTIHCHSKLVPVKNNVDKVMFLCYLLSCWIDPPSRPERRGLPSVPSNLPLLQHSTKTPSFVFNRLRTLLNSQFRISLIFSVHCALFAKNTRGWGYPSILKSPISHSPR